MCNKGNQTHIFLYPPRPSGIPRRHSEADIIQASIRLRYIIKFRTSELSSITGANHKKPSTSCADTAFWRNFSFMPAAKDVLWYYIINRLDLSSFSTPPETFWEFHHLWRLAEASVRHNFFCFPFTIFWSPDEGDFFRDSSMMYSKDRNNLSRTSLFLLLRE